MRRIRCWVKKDKCFKNIININLVSEKADISYGDISANLDHVKFSEIEIEPFTGIYDRNKIPIYRNDIINNAVENERLLVLGSLDEWGLFVERQKPFKYVTVLNKEHAEIKEIVGNIHENEWIL